MCQFIQVTVSSDDGRDHCGAPLQFTTVVYRLTKTSRSPNNVLHCLNLKAHAAGEVDFDCSKMTAQAGDLSHRTFTVARAD